MTVETGLPDSLTTIIERLIDRAFWGRHDSLRNTLLQRRDAARRAGIDDQSYHGRNQEDVGLTEYERRLRDVWLSYQRVIVEAGVPWSAELREAINSRLESVADAELQHVTAAVETHLHSSYGSPRLLADARTSIRDAILAEIDLFAIRYQAIGATLANALQSPRYAGPRMHWADAAAALRASPPNGRRAVNEAVGTVEALARIALGSPKATLGDCLKQLEAKQLIPAAAAKQLHLLWGQASNSPGVRHGSITGLPLPVAEAEYYIGIAESASKLLLTIDVAAI